MLQPCASVINRHAKHFSQQEEAAGASYKCSAEVKQPLLISEHWVYVKGAGAGSKTHRWSVFVCCVLTDTEHQVGALLKCVLVRDVVCVCGRQLCNF